MKKTLFGLITFLLILFLAACGGSDDSSDSDKEDTDSGGEAGGDEIEELTIKVSHVVAENTSQQAGSLALKEYIEEESDGKIEVQVYPNGQLFDDQAINQNIVANNAQFTQIDMAKLVGEDPRFNIPALPYLFDSDEEAIKFWDSEKGMEIISSLNDDGMYGLAMWPNGPKHLTNDKRPIKSPEDLKGLKFRTQGGQVLEKTFDLVGAGSVSLPFGELYTALQQGTVDGQTNTFVNIESKKFEEVQQYMTITGESRVDVVLFASTEFMESLNEPTRQLVEDGIDHATEAARTAASEMADEARQKLEDSGVMEIYELNDEEIEVFRETWEPVYDEFGPIIGEEYIEAAREANK